MCTPAGVSPLLSDSRGPSPYNEPEISILGTPVLFSQMSASSLWVISLIWFSYLANIKWKPEVSWVNMVVNIIKRSKKNKSCNKSRIHFQGLRILTGGSLGPFWKFEKGFGLRVHSRRFYYLFPLYRLGVKVVNDRLIWWLYKRYNSLRSSSPFGGVARSHARAAR